jgi:hypothetical protein
MRFQTKQKLQKLYKALATTDENTAFTMKSLEKGIVKLKLDLEEAKKKILPPDSRVDELGNMIKELSNKKVELPFDVSTLDKKIADLENSFNDTIIAFQENLVDNPPDLKPEVESLNKKLDLLRKEILSKIANQGGGSPNQKISVNGAWATKRYADINLIMSGATVSNDDTNKVTDIDLDGSGSEGFLKLDQTTPQTISNGQPIQDTLTASQIVATDANKKLQTLAVATYPSLTELSYVKGATSSLQTQIGTKQPQLNGTGFVKASGTTISYDNSTYLTSVTAHNLLSTTHGDTAAGSVVRGDVMIGNSTPKWDRLAFPATPTGKVLIATATDVSWSTSPLGTAAYSATGDFLASNNANFATLTNDSMADTLHRHSELSASDGSPNPAFWIGSGGAGHFNNAGEGAGSYYDGSGEDKWFWGTDGSADTMRLYSATKGANPISVAGATGVVSFPYGISIPNLRITNATAENVPTAYPNDAEALSIAFSNTLKFRFGGGNSGAYPCWIQVGKTDGTSVYPLLLNPLGGNIGIGTTNPGSPLDFAASLGSKISLYENSGYGIGVQDGIIQIYAGTTNVNRIGLGYGTSASFNEVLSVLGSGKVGIGTTAPTAVLHLKAGTATASTAPLKFTSGVSLTNAEAGAMEYTTDDLFFTISTGTARKRLLMADAVGGLTSGKIPVATTNGRLVDVTAQTELTDELTSITHTAPGTPDYALQDLTDSGGFGFKTKDEGNTVLSVILNLQTRVNELETKLTALGLLADAD